MGGILQGLGATVVAAESPVSVVRLLQVHCLDLPHQALCHGWGLVAAECPLPVFMINNGRKDNCDDDGVPCPTKIACMEQLYLRGQCILCSVALTRTGKIDHDLTDAIEYILRERTLNNIRRRKDLPYTVVPIL